MPQILPRYFSGPLYGVLPWQTVNPRFLVASALFLLRRGGGRRKSSKNTEIIRRWTRFSIQG
jgi:hypothetical protein